MSEYLKGQLQDSLAVVDTCLECIYQGKAHMYRPLAGQLRLLLCDTNRGTDNSLLAAIYPRLAVSSIEPISWSRDEAGGVRMARTAEGTNRIAQMPLQIDEYENGLVVADLLVQKDALLPIGRWADQRLTFHPTRLNVRTVVRTVADKGGGAHVDRNASADLQLMYQRTPPGRTYAELFVVGIGRFVQRLGEQLLGYKGCRLPEALTSTTHHRYNLLVAAHQDVADA
ncbi:MAG: hypothetical protein DCC58_05400 [Chloroflexi bacterium]|nr:MAG: hypothetical protein DCC58_05400 [Chloroflexota bacterium]